MRILTCGDRAILVEVDDLPAVLALAATARAADLPGVLDVVPAARTVLLVTAPGTDLGALRRAVLALPVDQAEGAPEGETVEIDVSYDGPDLDEVGHLTGLGRDGVIAAHTGTSWRVAFGGFAPGFAYLTGGDPRLGVARRHEPRISVPAGSVGLAGEFSGVYPRASPGGWQLIGRTGVALWAPERGALLRPGDQVRFTRGSAARERRTGPEHRRPRTGALEVVATGPQALVEDVGRPGLAATGVGRSGAADRAALRLANRLVANPEDAAGVEVLFGGLVVRARRHLTVALAGAPAPADVDGRPMGHHSVITLRPGQLLTLGPPPSGLRTYLAVRGGIDVDTVSGSRATDVLSGVGPAPLAAGDVLPTGPEPSTFPLVDVAPVALPPAGTVTLRAVLGPRADRFVDPAALARTTWTASERSDRVGMCLRGEPLRRHDRAELPSEGMVRGAIQVPPVGEPVLFLADHPVTGGYPVVAVVLDADVDRAAQVRPGQGVRFRLVDLPGSGSGVSENRGAIPRS